MYGMPGNRFGNAICVHADQVPDLVKEAQVAGKQTRVFFTEGKELWLGFDGMFVVNTKTGDLVDEGGLTHGPLFTMVLS